MWSLVRLRKTYDLPIKDFVRGHVTGYEAQPLDDVTPFELALMCLGHGEPDEAIQWLEGHQWRRWGDESSERFPGSWKSLRSGKRPSYPQSVRVDSASHPVQRKAK